MANVNHNKFAKRAMAWKHKLNNKYDDSKSLMDIYGLD